MNLTDSQVKRADKVVQRVLNARKKKEIEIKSGLFVIYFCFGFKCSKNK